MAMTCPECETLPFTIFPQNLLLIRLPTGHSVSKMLTMIQALGLDTGRMEDPLCYRFHLSETALIELMVALSDGLTGEELTHSRCVILPVDREPGISDLLAATTLRQAIANIRGQWLTRLLQEDRYFSMLQPIYGADGAPFGYEALFRGRSEEGNILAPHALFGMAEEAGLLFALDLKARQSAINTMARRSQDGAHLFVNFNPSSIYDPDYCLRTTRDLVRRVGLTPENVVFEVTETTRAHDENHLRAILDYYRAAGFQVALDDIGAGFSGLNLLQLLQPDFMKIDMALIRDVDTDGYKQSIVRHLIGIAHDCGAKVVAEGIETGGELAWVRDAGADLVQGYLLGRPMAVA